MRKKIIAVILLIVICIMATGCDHVSNGESSGFNVFLYVDPVTGVNYVHSSQGGITPRLNPDGSLYVSEVK